MFNTGDRIEIEQRGGRKSTATIKSLEYRGGCWIALVIRDDNGEADLWVWSNYQVGISVRKVI